MSTCINVGGKTAADWHKSKLEYDISYGPSWNIKCQWISHLKTSNGSWDISPCACIYVIVNGLGDTFGDYPLGRIPSRILQNEKAVVSDTVPFRHPVKILQV